MFGGGGGDFFVIGVVVFLGMVVRALNSGLEWGCDWGCCNFGGGGDDLVGDDDEEEDGLLWKCRGMPKNDFVMPKDKGKQRNKKIQTTQ